MSDYRINLLRCVVLYGLRYAHALSCPLRGTHLRVTPDNHSPCDCHGFPVKHVKLGGDIADMGNAPIGYQWDRAQRRYLPIYKP